MSLRHVQRAASWRRLSSTTAWVRGINTLRRCTSDNNVLTRTRRTSTLPRTYHAPPPGVLDTPPPDMLAKNTIPEATDATLSYEVVIFHKPSCELSRKLLRKLRRAQDAFPSKKYPPMKFEITMQTRLPTVDEFEDLYRRLEVPSWTAFLDPKSSEQKYFRHHPTSARTLVDIIEFTQAKERKRFCENPPRSTKYPQDPDHPFFGTDLLAWPFVVCWQGPHVSVGNQAGSRGVRQILRWVFSQYGKARQHALEEAKKKTAPVDAASDGLETATAPKEESPPEDKPMKWFD